MLADIRLATRRRERSNALRIGLIGTRGIPAAYGGFETAIEEIGSRLVDRGHDVIVHCRTGNAAKLSGDPTTPDPRSYRGMQLVHLPAVGIKAAETISHTTASGIRHLMLRDTDINIVFNAANSTLIPLLRAGKTPVLVHVDGLEWKRSKWGMLGKQYYRYAESLAVRWGDGLIADAVGIQEYYRLQFGVETTMIPYGAPILNYVGTDSLPELKLRHRGYHLVVARLEPENHVDMIVEGYHRSSATLPLVVVGTAPYAAQYIDRLHRIADKDTRIVLLGAVWNQKTLNQLYGNCFTYIHGHSVGGTNPSLLRAMGAGVPTLAYDVVFNREVLGADAEYFSQARELSHLLEGAESTPAYVARRGKRSRARAIKNYNWDRVAEDYERLALRTVAGASTRGSVSGRRCGQPQSDGRIGKEKTNEASPPLPKCDENAQES